MLQEHQWTSLLWGTTRHLPSRDTVALLCYHVSSPTSPPDNIHVINARSCSLLLFVIYFPRATSPISPTESESSARNGPSYTTALVVSGICILHAVVMFITSAAIAVNRPSQLQAWSNFSGVVAAILASIQYFPQIYTTLRLRCVGSLSIPMMCIQTPGSLVWAGSLAARLGPKGWSTWGVLIVTACLQGTLLAMAIFFENFGPNKQRNHRHGKDLPPNGSGEGPEERDHEQPSEETPLLQGQ